MVDVLVVIVEILTVICQEDDQTGVHQTPGREAIQQLARESITTHDRGVVESVEMLDISVAE